MATRTEPEAIWHAMPIELCLNRIGSSRRGLSRAEAESRLATFGPNEIQSAARISPWRLLLDQFRNTLILILLIGVALSAVLGHAVEAVAIAIIVLFAAILGFVQEFRAERSMEALREMAAPTATVLRDGEELEIPSRELVPGDLILLSAGDRVPADARLTLAVNLRADESALTGESVSIGKQADETITNGTAIGDRCNMVHAGTVITYGRGQALVTATGMETEFGQVARMLQSVESTRTPLQENLEKVGSALAKAALAVVAIIVAIGILRGQAILDMFIFGIALAVAVVPEALPAVVTISLAIGVQRMAKRNALVRRLNAVETLGCTSVICADKTGTLTKDEMTVRQMYVNGRIVEVTGAGYEPVGEFQEDGMTVEPSISVKQLLKAAILASDAHIAHDESTSRWQVKGDPTEGALVVAAAKAGLQKREADAECPRVSEIPFTSEAKRMTTIHCTIDGQAAFSKGAPEVILGSCTRMLNEDRECELDGNSREEILDVAREMACGGLRVLGIASRLHATLENAQSEMTFLGLVGMSDPPRPEAKAAIDCCDKAGIRVMMITGDHPLTAESVAREIGLLRKGSIITGSMLASMSEPQLLNEIDEVEVFARVSPADKLRVVAAVQQQGHIAAMTGDGVNDAPALKKAAIGIAMGRTGTDVTKEAAAMTLTDDNFASIVAAVEEGRAIYGNIKKYLMYLLSSNIGEIGLMAGASLFGLPLPLTAVMLLYVNLATDGLPALALAVDPPDPDLMKLPPRRPSRGIFTLPVVVLMTAGGLWSAVINLGLFAWALDHGRSQKEAMTLTFVSLVLIQFLKAYNFRSDRHSVLIRPFANRWLNLAVAWELIMLILILRIPFLRAPFGTEAISGSDWLLAIIPALTISPVLEIMKAMVRRGWFGQLD